MQGVTRKMDVKHSETGAAALGTPVTYVKHLLNRKINFTAIDAASTYDIEGTDDPFGVTGGVAMTQTWTTVKAGITTTGSVDIPDNYHHYRVNTKVYGGAGTSAAAVLMGIDQDMQASA